MQFFSPSARVIACAAALFLFPWAGAAQDSSPLLPPIYQTGKGYVFQVHQNIEVPLALGPGGQPTATQKADFVLDIGADCKKDKKNRDHRLVTASVKRAKTSISMGNVLFEYDSDAPNNQENILSGAFKGVVGKEYAFVLDEANEVVEMRGEDEVEEQPNNFMQVRFGAEQVRQLMLPAVNLGIPSGGAVPGDSWENTTDLTIGPAGKVNAVYNYTYSGDEGNQARIDYTAKLTIKADMGGDDDDPKVPVELKDGAIEGFMTIDKELRFPLEGKASVKAALTTTHPADPTRKLELPMTMTIGYDLLSVEKAKGLF